MLYLRCSRVAGLVLGDFGYTEIYIDSKSYFLPDKYIHDIHVTQRTVQPDAPTHQVTAECANTASSNFLNAESHAIHDHINVRFVKSIDRVYLV